MALDYIVGIDIGSYKVCASVGKIDKQNKLQIIGITQAMCSGLKKGIVVDIDSTAEAIRSCMEQLVRMIDYEIKDAYISLSGGLCELFWNNGVVAVSSDDREIRHTDVERVLKAACAVNLPQDKEVIGVLEDQYIVDGYNDIKDPVGMSGLRLEVEANLVVTGSAIMNNLYKSMEKAGIKVDGVVLKPIAISDCILRRDEKQVGTLILDVGADTIDASIISNEKLRYTTMLPVGGNNITNDMSICLKIPSETAERIKIKHGTVIPSGFKEKIKISDKYSESITIDYDTLAEIIKARVEESLRIIHKRVLSCKEFSSISSVVIVGGGFSLIKGVPELAKEIFNLPVRIGAPDYVGAASPIYSTSVGIIKNVYEARKEDLKEVAADNENDDIYEDYEDRKEKDGFVKKLKDFFTDFF